MAGRITLGIVKPDAVAKGNLGNIVAHLERDGWKVRAGRLARLTKPEAEAFYEVHRGQRFYGELVDFMTSGPCFPMAVEKDDAVKAFRTLIGATDPAEAAPGTIRKLYGESKGRNAIHGSDSDENAAREVAFFFAEAERAGLWG
ncbi:MAG: nucleoside-diphosphate kinase [Gemmatimonadales bacterium]